MAAVARSSVISVGTSFTVLAFWSFCCCRSCGALVPAKCADSLARRTASPLPAGGSPAHALLLRPSPPARVAQIARECESRRRGTRCRRSGCTHCAAQALKTPIAVSLFSNNRLTPNRLTIIGARSVQLQLLDTCAHVLRVITVSTTVVDGSNIVGKELTQRNSDRYCSLTNTLNYTTCDTLTNTFRPCHIPIKDNRATTYYHLPRRNMRFYCVYAFLDSWC